MVNRTFISGTGLLLAAVLFVAVIIVVNATLTTWRVDLTENKLFTLSDGTINILSNIKEPIRLDFYFSQKALTGFPQLSNYGNRVRDMLQEYAAHADGKLVLHVIDAETFSEEEDQAVASGLQGISISTAGDRAYLGLVGVNSTDEQEVIPFFQTERESALEYDITKLIYNLDHPQKPVIGVMTSLPMFGDDQQPGMKPWTITSAMKEFFDVRDLGVKADIISPDINVLMIVHPKDLKAKTRFAIDQYVLKGGKVLLFLDPLAESDRVASDPQNQAVLPDIDSELPQLLDRWGVEMLPELIAGDINAAMHVQTRSQRGMQEIAYLPWLRLADECFNKQDFSTSELSVVHLGTAGILVKKSDVKTSFIPLIETTRQSMQLSRDFLMIQRDPSVILDNFKSSESRQTLAARLQGRATTAFPDGIPAEESTTAGEAGADTKPAAPQNAAGLVREGDINVIVVSDTDMLTDLFWIRTQSYLGMDLPQPIADNGNFVINALENLSGSNDLISLRSRGEFTRPFDRVEAIRRDAEFKFREHEQQLQAKLEETEQKIKKLQEEQGNNTAVMLTPEQSREMEKFLKIRIETRKELRAVQHELKKNIEDLGTRLRILNIGLVPLLVIFISIGTGIYRVSRRK
ncbi:MAG: GldG family protein [Gammaproteobacteria bacterium]